MLNLEWFRTFKAIYETGTLSAAAQILFISQPGVSLHLNSLESYTGYQLFERETRRMIPTDRGVMLYNSLDDPINKLEKAEKLFHRNSKFERPTIGVGVCFETFQYTLEEYIPLLPFNLIIRFGESQQMLHDLETGAVDLVITPQQGHQATFEFVPFAKEKIIIICGDGTDTDEFEQLIKINDRSQIKEWLKKQFWYTTVADMENIKNFWLLNFDELPDFKPSYVVPNHGSVLRCLSNANGFALIPDFLCENEIGNSLIRQAWQGPYLENTMYFGKRKRTLYAKEIQQLENILTGNWLAKHPPN